LQIAARRNQRGRARFAQRFPPHGDARALGLSRTKRGADTPAAASPIAPVDARIRPRSAADGPPGA
jgi:hypothetical protein